MPQHIEVGGVFASYEGGECDISHYIEHDHLVIPQKSARPREAGGLDEGAPEILRCAQDDSWGVCHPERSEGSLVDFWGITRAHNGRVQ